MEDFEAECFKLAEMIRNLAKQTSREEVPHLLDQAATFVLAAASWHHSFQPLESAESDPQE
jgi:hypothetical protein